MGMCRNSPGHGTTYIFTPMRELGRIYPAPKPSTDISLKMRLTTQKISKCQNRHGFCRPETMSGESVPSSFCFLLSLEARHTHTLTYPVYKLPPPAGSKNSHPETKLYI